MVIGARAGFAILDTDGTLLKTVGSQGTGVDQFDQVTGIAIDDNGNILAVDTYNNRISKYNANGERLWIVQTGAPGNDETLSGGNSMSSETSAVAAMQLPLGATLDGNGRLVVVDSFDFSLNVFDSTDGAFIAKYGKFGGADGSFYTRAASHTIPTATGSPVADTGIYECRSYESLVEFRNRAGAAPGSCRTAPRVLHTALPALAPRHLLGPDEEEKKAQCRAGTRRYGAQSGCCAE